MFNATDNKDIEELVLPYYVNSRFQWSQQVY